MIFSKETATFFEIYKQLEVENQEYINNSLPNLTLQEIDVNFKLQSGEKVFSNTPVTIYLQHHTKKPAVQLYSKYTIPFENGISVVVMQERKLRKYTKCLFKMVICLLQINEF